MASNNLYLSWKEKVRRALYVVLRNELDGDLIKCALIDSFKNFQSKNHPYPFIEMRELKPKARIFDREYEYQNSFLVLFCESALPDRYKRYIRFFDSNKITKENLCSTLDFNISDDFSLNSKYFESKHFKKLFSSLLPVDYALLLQRDATVKSKNRYVLTHFHVKIDWPVANAAEDLGKELRYLTKDLYERGEKHGEILQQKLFEYFGFHHTVGGRRTAAVVASQFMRQMDSLFTVYVASSSSRSLMKISEHSISRYLLIKLSNEEMQNLAKSNHMRMDTFVKRFIIHREKDYGVGIFHVVYEHTIYSKPPADGKVRSLNPDYRWLTVVHQLLVPIPSVKDLRPIEYPVIYSA